jgi:signal transduction histidine kinase
LQLSVTDDGEGVAPEHLDKIFTPFFTAGSRSLGAHRGTGLGLAIVHECVTRLGGRISVSNVTGRGACFQVTLPNPIPAGGDA